MCRAGTRCCPTSTAFSIRQRRASRRASFLYGHSLGGSLVLSYVLRRRPRLAGAIVTSPALRPAFEPARWRVALGKGLCRVQPGLLMSNGLDRNGLSHDPAVARAYAGDPLVHDRLSARLGVNLLAYGREALGDAAQLPLPLLLMHGNADPICSFAASREFAEKASPTGRCTFKEWDGLYHELHNELQQGEVMHTMIAWLDAHLPVSGPRSLLRKADGREGRSGHAATKARETQEARRPGSRKKRR